MLSFLPPLLRGTITIFLLSLNTVLLVPLLIIVALVRIAIPYKPWHQICTRWAIRIAEAWMKLNSGWMWLTQKLDWDVEGVENLCMDHWYLVTSNHQSWADIFILQHLLNRKIPMLKFFLKQQLIFVPVIGLAWWALDFPFMKRYSKQYLAKHPEKRGQDLESTRRACEKFKYTPVTIFNFLEGTRFTPEKHQLQNSPYRHLLKPKAGGIAYVIGAMGDSIHSLLNITITYPKHWQPTFWEFMSGQVKRVIVRVDQQTIPEQFLNKNYMEDEQFRQEFQQWVSDLWAEKDQLLDELNQTSEGSSPP